MVSPNSGGGSGSAAAAGGGGGGNKDARGPAGANLFIYNLPLTFTDSDLAGLFASFGQLLSSHIQRDRTTGNSKGFGSFSAAACVLCGV